MSRPLRINFPGATYHVTSRGNARAEIFRDDPERHLFYEVLASVVEDFNWICHADCQMSNHFHLAVETPEANLSEGMRQLNGVFTQRINKSRGTVGHILQGRFYARLIDHDAYFLEVARYIVLNPVRSGVVARPMDWRWSSYRATAGLRPAWGFQHVAGIRARFSADDRQATAAYRRFVIGGIGAPSPFLAAKGGILGDEDFVRRVTEQVPASITAASEIPRRERLAARPALAELYNPARNNKTARDEAARLAWRKYGYAMSEIARSFDVHYTTISKILRKK